MTTRLLILKLVGTLAALIAGGCGLPPIAVKPMPSIDPKPQTIELKITVDGEGKIAVGGSGSVDVKSSRNVDACACGCQQVNCDCSKGNQSATVVAQQLSPPPKMVYECRGGVCGWYPVTASAPRPRSAAVNSNVTVYISDSPACRAMQSALAGVKGIEFKRGTPPLIGGLHWWPTAVRADGAVWSPRQSGWHSGSIVEFQTWAGK